MQFGVHLPLIAFDDRPFTLERIKTVAAAARTLGFDSVAANDHLVFARPWLDGPTALAAVLDDTGDLPLFTTVALVVVRGPAALAKTLSGIDVLSGGRVVAGVGPGSSARDYEAVGLDFGERWKRLDDAIPALRAYLARDAEPYEGHFYSAQEPFQPLAKRLAPMPIWIGSWGSDAGLRRVARLADGWLASAYNTTPQQFAAGRKELTGLLEAAGRDPSPFPNGLATTLMYLADTEAEADRVLDEVVIPAMNRPRDELADRLLVCTPETAVEKIGRYKAAGLQQMFLWPLLDEAGQLERFAAEVRPKLG
jgi:alkanesulfonate monooxygenase SsuD/methylene tetrahydromethanopterin reductase-like flavin-dependent oxidoreductase (luciferase family)